MLTASIVETRRKNVLAYIVKFQGENGGSSPTIREIAAGIGYYAVGAIHGILRELEAEGFIQRSGQSRDIRILKTFPECAPMTLGQAADSFVTGLLVRRLERIPQMKADAIALSDRLALARVEAEEKALQEILDEVGARVHGVRRAAE